VNLLTVTEISKRLRLSAAFVYARIADGSMPHYKIGGAVRVSEQQLAAYLASAERGPNHVRVSVKPLKNLSM